MRNGGSALKLGQTALGKPMTLLMPALILAGSALCFWRADAIGRTLKKFDGGGLQRRMSSLSGDARGYPIDAAERKTVREWIAKLREPGAGYVA